MSAKRALVVDDSKSARAFLSRLLEKHNLDVDTAESAEDAIEYLNRHRPDVIFMDHLMPGMDGFQAVQVIKNNPRTATIPILMYTSQEGELYLGQARALGAVGVLPKQIKPADVSTVLHQLHLAEERRDPAHASTYHGEERRHSELVLQPVGGPAPAPSIDLGEDTSELVLPPPLLQATGQATGHTTGQPTGQSTGATSRQMALPFVELAALREEIGELRRLVVTGFDAQTERVLAEMKHTLAALPPAEPLPASRDWLGTFYALLATGAAVLLAVLWLRGEVDRRALEMQVAQLSATHTTLVTEPATASPAETGEVAAPPAAAAPAAAGEGRRAPQPALPLVLPVPYGEPPLGGTRVERLRSLLNQLADGGYQGFVEVQSFPGRFCLAGNATDGYSLAPDTTPVAQCEFGNPGDETAQRESLPFANMVAEFRKAHGNAVTLSFTNGAPDQVQRAYPESGANGRPVTAGEWNAAAAQNSRVEIRWHPRS